MKKLHSILYVILLVAILSACGSGSAPETSPETPEAPEMQAPTVSVEEYKTMVSEFNAHLMDEALILANAGMYEYNYWKTFSGLPAYGDLDYQSMAESAMEWLSEKSDASAETVEAAYGELIASCVDISDANVDGDIPEELPDLVVALFGAYDCLYSLVTEPSGEIEDFVVQLRDYTEVITTFNEDISSLVEGI